MNPFCFGPLTVRVDAGGPATRSVLRREMALYTRAPDSTPPDIALRVVPAISHDGLRSTSPSVHMEFEDGFGGAFGRFLTVRWRLRGPTVHVDLALRKGPLGRVRRYRNPSFHDPSQDIGKFAHEIGLVGTVQMFRPDALMFLHGAALADDDGNGVVIGGTGGVGKTSLALELGRRHRWRFISDDMVGLDARGTLHLNANWPKIYAYNTQGDEKLEAHVLRDRSWLDRAHWRVLKPFPSLVRRTLAPDDLHPRGVVASAPLKDLYLVFRTDVTAIHVRRCDPHAAAVACAEIVTAEQSVLGRHVAWSRATRAALGLDPLLEEWGPEPWTRRLERSLAACHCHLVQVPRAMGAVAYREAMARALVGERPPRRRQSGRA